jgi:hypothetical protein
MLSPTGREFVGPGESAVLSLEAPGILVAKGSRNGKMKRSIHEELARA